MRIKSKLAAKQKTSAKIILLLVLALGSMVSETKMPSLAASKPPEVAGSTNLLRTMCCKITPLTDKPTPVSTSAISRGIRLAVKVNHASLEKLKRAISEVCFEPSIRETAQSKMSNKDSERIIEVLLTYYE